MKNEKKTPLEDNRVYIHKYELMRRDMYGLIEIKCDAVDCTNNDKRFEDNGGFCMCDSIEFNGSRCLQYERDMVYLRRIWKEDTYKGMSSLQRAKAVDEERNKVNMPKKMSGGGWVET